MKKEKDVLGIEPIVQKVLNYYKNAYDAKSKFTEQWKKNYKAYTGELFERGSVNKKLGNAIPNHIFSTVETIKPIMVTNPPKNIVLPTKEDGFEKAMLIQDALDYEWQRTRLLSKLTDSLTNGLICGTLIQGLFWDGKDNKGLGNIKPVSISPFNFFIDPMAEYIDEAEYVMYATYKSLGELMKYYPDKADELEDQASSDIDDDLTFGKDKTNAKDQILFIECYLRDYTRVEEEEEDEEGNRYKVKRPKYPNGRRVIIAGDVLLADGENPYEDGRFPFVSWTCYKVPGQFWGMSEVEELISVQTEMCNLYNALIDNAKLNGNPWVIKDKNAGVETKSLTNTPGLVITKNPGSEVKRDAPPPMPAYIQQVIQDLKYDVQVISGVFDATRGERPVSITSGVAIQALTESSQGRIRLKIQALENMLSELGSMWLSRMQQFWELPRTIRTMGGQYEPDSMPLMIDGQPVKFNEISKDEIDGDFDVVIKTGSTMPVNKSARLETVMRLAQTMAEDGMPMIDRRTVIEYCDLDNPEDIIRRFEEQAQRNAEQQAMEQQRQEQLMILQQQQDMANMQINQKNQMEAKAIDIQAKKEEKLMDAQLQAQQTVLQNSLQNNTDGVQSNQNNSSQSNIPDIDIDNMSIEELINLIKTLDEGQLNELINKYPEIADVLAMLQQISGQSQVENPQGEVK